MDDKDLLLVMTICDLLGKPVKPEEVDKAFAKAQERLERSGRPPREAKISHAHRRD
jgi:hypothetical protein